MRKIVYAVFAACALAFHAAHAMTGAEAAQRIKSEPSEAYYVTPDTFNLVWAYYDGGEIKKANFTIGVDSWQTDVEAAVSSLKKTVNSVALDACMALAKTEALQEVDRYTNARVDVLTDSTKYAMSQLDEVRQTDSDQDTTIQEVSGRATPPDGVSISKIGGDVGVLALHGFAGAVGADWYLPHPSGGVLGWNSVIDLFDGVTIGGSAYSPGAFGIRFGLKGWGSPTESPGACVRTLSGLLHGDDPDGPHYVLTKCGGALHYTPLGQPLNDGVAVDNLSLTTNQATGASMQGVASLYGWDLAGTKAGFIPAKGDGSTATLKWLDPAEMVDDDSLALTTADGGAKVWEVKGAHTYAGNHGRHYFGTGDDSALGWHELPNVTTNNVVGDEHSISSTPGEGDQKVFSLFGWPPPVDGVPYAVGSVSGSLAFLPLPELLTNGIACVCSNRWAALLGWFGDGMVSDSHGIDFTTGDLGEHVHDLGFFKTNDVDNISLGASGGKAQIARFATAAGCEADITSMLKDPTGANAGKHLFLANYAGDDGRELHYVSIGDGIADARSLVDNESIVTNNGKIAIFGYGANGSKGKFLRHGDETGVEWVDIPTNGVDDASIEVVDGKLQIVGFDPSNNNAVPRVDNGRIVWGGASSATNLYVAGSYIEMADGGGGVVTVSAQSKTLDVITGISFSFNADNQLVATVTKQTVTVLDKATQTSEATATIPLWKQNVVIASEYSTQDHTFKNTSIGGVRTVETLPSQPSQTTVFTATAHSGQ